MFIQVFGESYQKSVDFTCDFCIIFSCLIKHDILFSFTKLKGGDLTDIGKRLKQLRMRQNLTLDELASRCELTKGFLSQLERGLTSPSIATLEDIVEALGYSMSEFFKEEAEEKIQGLLEEAEALLDTESLPRNGYYAFVCEKCAPVFGHYGWFMTEAELEKRVGESREAFPDKIKFRNYFRREIHAEPRPAPITIRPPPMTATRLAWKGRSFGPKA